MTEKILIIVPTYDERENVVAISEAILQQVPSANILFVDDNPVLVRVYASVLQDESHRWEVRSATSGEQALDLMAEAPFDVVVTDLRMPQMSGTELMVKTRALRGQIPNAKSQITNRPAGLAFGLLELWPLHRLAVLRCASSRPRPSSRSRFPAAGG